MGYDRIAYFEGTDAETTLISGNKEAARVVYGFGLQAFLGRLGFKTKVVVDRQEVANLAQYRPRIEAEIKDLPEHTRAWFTRGEFLEISPPIDDSMTRILNAYFEAHCPTNDAGIILDYRADPPTVVGGF